MEMDTILNAALTAAVSFMAWYIKSQSDEINRVQILLNKTREDMAREYVTKSDSNQVLMQIMNKFDKLEEKIDRLIMEK